MELNSSNYLKIWLKPNLTYRYYRKLSDRQKEILEQAQLEPDKQLFVFKIMEVLEVGIKRAIHLSNQYRDDYMAWVNKNYIENPRKPISEKRAIKEFKHQGFKAIPYRNDLSKFEANIINGLKTLNLDLELSYITSNKVLDGHIYILPVGFNYSYSNIQKHPNKKYIMNVYGLYGVVGHTKLYY